MRQLEACPYFQVTLETGFRRLARIDNRVRPAATLDVEASRAVTRFTADVLSVLSSRHQPGVRRSAEVAYDVFVAGLTFFGANELGAGNARRRKNCSIGRAAGK